MSKKEQIAELTAKGLSAQEIAKKVNLKVATVYTYQSMLRKQEAKQKEQPKENDKAEVNKVNSAATNESYEKNIKEKEEIINDLEKLNREKQKHLEQSQKDYKELNHRFRNVVKNYDSLEEKNNELKRDLQSYKESNERLTAIKFNVEKENEKLKEELKQLNKVAEELDVTEKDKVIEQLRSENKKLDSDFQFLNNRYNNLKKENKLIKEALSVQQSLHYILLDYVSILHKWGKKYE